MEADFRAVYVPLPPEHEPALQDAVRLVADLIRREDVSNKHEIASEEHESATERGPVSYFQKTCISGVTGP